LSSYRLLRVLARWSQAAHYLVAGVAVLLAGLLCYALLTSGSASAALHQLFPGMDTSLRTLVFLWLADLFLWGITGLALLHTFLPRQAGDLYLFSSDQGVVSIPLGTIAEFVEHEASRIPGVNHIRVHVYREGSSLALALEAQVTAQEPLPELTEDLRSFIQKELREMIGIRDVGPIHMNIQQITSDTRPVLLPHSSQRSNPVRIAHNGGNSVA